jgi:general secretion pathway protein G
MHMVGAMRSHRFVRGFTIIELMVVMAVIGLLMSVVVPRYFKQVDKAQESTLKQNLFVLRDAIDKHYADKEHYPENLAALVEGKYLRRVPVDPLTGRSDSWVLVPPENKSLGGVFDIRSGASGRATDGSAYASW